MKTFQCLDCKLEVKLKKLPEDYKCPKCGATKERHEEKENKKKTLFLLFLYSLTLLMLIISGAFTISTIYNQSKGPHHNVEVGNLSIDLVQQNDTTIRLYNFSPMSDGKAMTLDPYLFKLNNNGTYALNYTIKLVDVPNKELTGVQEIVGKTRISNKKVKFSLTNTNTNEVIKQGFVSDLTNNIITSGRIKAAKVEPYALRLWIDKNVGNEDQNKFYAGRIVLSVDEILECTDDDRDECDHHGHYKDKD